MRMATAILLLTSVIGQVTCVEVAVSEDGVALNGTQVDFPVPSNELLSILGNPNRTSNLANKIYTWDRLGITAYAKGKDPEMVTEVQLITQKEPFPFSPKEEFSGTINLFGTPYRHDISGKELTDLGFEARKVMGPMRYLYRKGKVYCNIDTVDKSIGWSHVTLSNP